MDNTIHRYFKVGLVYSQAYPQTFKSDEIFVPSLEKLVKEGYFKVIEFHSPKDRGIRRECIGILNDSGMYRVYLGTMEFMNARANMHSFDRRAREDAFDLSRRLVDDALEWGCEEVMFSSAPDPGEKKRKDAYKYLEEYYIKLADYIKQNRHINLTMEVIDRNPVAKNFLCGSTSEAKDVWKNVRKETPNFGLVIDLCHLPLLGEKPGDAVREAGEAFVHGHIGTCVKNTKSVLCGDMHPGFQAEGSENNVSDVVEFIRAGMETGAISEKHPMPFSIEVRPYGKETTDYVVEYAKDVLSRAWDEVIR